jgi:hypothetical protein
LKHDLNLGIANILKTTSKHETKHTSSKIKSATRQQKTKTKPNNIAVVAGQETEAGLLKIHCRNNNKLPPANTET